MTLAAVPTSPTPIHRTPPADTLERSARTEIGTPLECFLKAERDRGQPIRHIFRVVCRVMGEVAGRFLARQEAADKVLSASNAMCDAAGHFAESGFDACRDAIDETAQPQRLTAEQRKAETERLLADTRADIASKLAYAESLERNIEDIDRADAGKPIKTPRDLCIGRRRD